MSLVLLAGLARRWDLGKASVVPVLQTGEKEGGKKVLVPKIKAYPNDFHLGVCL